MRAHPLQGHGVTLAVFAAAIFLSAGLVFSVQPLFTKMVLPTLGGAPSVMVVAAPTERASMPEPGELRAFYVPGTVGIMLWRGTWHALTRFPATPGGAGFAFLTDAHTQRELEKQRADGTPPRLTQEIDYRERCGVSFEVVDPEGLLAAGSGG